MLGAEQAPSTYLNQCWPSSPTHICGTRGRWVKPIHHVNIQHFPPTCYHHKDNDMSVITELPVNSPHKKLSGWLCWYASEPFTYLVRLCTSVNAKFKLIYIEKKSFVFLNLHRHLRSLYWLVQFYLWRLSYLHQFIFPGQSPCPLPGAIVDPCGTPNRRAGGMWKLPFCSSHMQSTLPGVCLDKFVP